MKKIFKKIKLSTFIGINIALCASIRSIPILASVGWKLFIYIFLAVFLFAIPLCLISGELSSMVSSKNNGPHLWVKMALGKKWSFVTSWLLWVQIFPGMVMVSSTLVPIISYIIGNDIIYKNNLFVMFCILINYWFLTLINLKFDMPKITGKIGVWFGVYLPFIFMFIFGILSYFKLGFNNNSYLKNLNILNFFPSFNNLSSIKYLASIFFIFIGIEISSIYIPRLENTIIDYKKGIFISLIILIICNLINSILFSNFMTFNKIEIFNILQPIIFYCKFLKIPYIFCRVFGLMLFIGIIMQLSIWIIGPAKTISQVAKDGLLPKKIGFHIENKNGVSKNVLFIQAFIISIFTFFYAFIKDVNFIFLILTNITTIVYSITYILIAISIIILRLKFPKKKRLYRVGKNINSNLYLYFIVLIFLLSIFIIFFSVNIDMDFFSILLILIISFIMFILPLIIFKIMKN